MKSFRKYLTIVILSSFSYLCIFLFRNYNSPENVEKRCLLKFQKDAEDATNASHKEWDLIMDIADNNYIKCMGFPQY